jgi:glucose-1-phosphate thymidylyltransferase
VQHTAEGTAHAVGAASEYLEGNGVVVFADTLFAMDETVDIGDADVIAWVKQVEDPRRFGIAVRDGERVTKLIEKPEDPVSNEALIGIYYVKELADLHDEINYLIDNDVRGKGGEFQLTDAFDRLLQAGKLFKTASVSAWMDCGTIPALLETTGKILDRESDDLHHGTVTDSVIHDPVYIGPGATVEGSVVGPHVSIEAGAEVTGSIMRDSIVFSEGRVKQSVLRDSIVGREALAEGKAQVVNIGDHSEIVG